MDEKHKMEMTKKYKSGATEWRCNKCSRHLIMQTTPFKSITLSQGDFKALHYGGQINLNIDVKDPASVTPKDDATRH